MLLGLKSRGEKGLNQKCRRKSDLRRNELFFDMRPKMEWDVRPKIKK